MTTIRRFEDGDRAHWERLWQGYLAFYEAEVAAATTDVTWRRLLTPGEDPQGFTAVDAGGRPIGLSTTTSTAPVGTSTTSATCRTCSSSPRIAATAPGRR